MLTLTTLRPQALALPLIFAATLSMAQTETPQDSADEAPGVEADLSLGEVATTGPQLGEPYIKETFGDWNMRCVKSNEDEDPCQMYQLLADGDGAPISEVTLFRLPTGGQAEAGAAIMVPLETSLAAQLTMKIDDNDARRYPFAFCNTVGCVSRIGLTPDDVTALKRGSKAIVTIVPIVAPDQKVDVNLSLKGFTAAYDKVSVLNQ
ncbi:invasion associated locus B family protein [Roseobacter sp.]|uniref:invasion associated locus B family protein n=1 Tax=Roseobacter sp. TaxID=1907202 RepID=UPI003298CB33